MEILDSSVLFYIVCGAFCVMMARYAKKSPKLSFWLIVLTLSLVAGLRKYTVGVDTEAYYKVFEYLGKLRPINTSFSLILKICSKTSLTEFSLTTLTFSNRRLK